MVAGRIILVVDLAAIHEITRLHQMSRGHRIFSLKGSGTKLDLLGMCSAQEASEKIRQAKPIPLERLGSPKSLRSALMKK